MTTVDCTWPEKDAALLVPPLPYVIEDWDVIAACPWCRGFGIEDETDFDPMAPRACANCHKLYKVEPLGFELIRIVGIRSETDERFMSMHFLTEALVNFVHFYEAINDR